MTDKNKIFIRDEILARTRLARGLADLEAISIGGISFSGTSRVSANMVEVERGIEELAKMFCAEIAIEYGEPRTDYRLVRKSFKFGDVEIYHENYEKIEVNE